MPNRCLGTAKSEPMMGGHIALRDRDEAREARFGREQIVIIGIKTAIGDPISDLEKLPFRIEEKIERHRLEYLPRKLTQRCDATFERNGGLSRAFEAIDQ